MAPRPLKPQPKAEESGLPIWVSITGVLVLLGLLVWNVVANGNDGYPTSVILGGLLGGLFGFDKLLKRRGGE